MSFAPKPQTYVPDLGTWFSTPSAMRRRTASRIGVRLTPQALAKEGSESFCPGLSSPRVDRPNDFDYRLVTPKHFQEFYEAIRAGEQTIDNFEYSVPLAKTVCLGNISALAGKGSVLKWDGHHVTNDPKADKNVTMSYRKGWDPFEEA